MEAGALGRPSVGADDGGVPEIVLAGRTGLLARPDDPADFARCLGELLTDPSRAAAMGSQAREWVRGHFSTAALVERSYGVLQQIVGRELAP